MVSSINPNILRELMWLSCDCKIASLFVTLILNLISIHAQRRQMLFMSSSTQHHVPMQHVLPRPRWPTWWYASELWGRLTWVPPLTALRLLTHIWGHCVAVALAGRLPAPPAAGKGTGVLWLQPPSSPGVTEMNSFVHSSVCSHFCRDF